MPAKLRPSDLGGGGPHACCLQVNNNFKQKRKTDFVLMEGHFVIFGDQKTKQMVNKEGTLR